MRTVITALTFMFFLTLPATAQEISTPAREDSVTVSVESLRNLKHEFKVLERKVEIQDTIITEQELQIKLYKRRLKQDSLLNDLSEQQLNVRQERIELKEERIEELESEKTWLKIGTGAAAILGFLLGAT